MSCLKAIICHVLLSTILALYRPSNVTQLTSQNFYNLINDDNIWVIWFHSSNSKKDQAFTKEFTVSADILKGIVKCGSVNVDNNLELIRDFTTNKKSLPLVKFYGISDDGPTEYTGPKTARDLAETVVMSIVEKVEVKLGRLYENLVEELSDSSFNKVVAESEEPWMVLFYAPWCSHCEEFQPIWKLVASSLHKKVRCGSIDATVNKRIADEYHITEYPTIKLLPFKNKSPKHVFDYRGDRSVDIIVEWALKQLPAPDIVQLLNAAIFQKHCMDQNMCTITILPSIFDCQSQCRLKYLNILEEIVLKFKSQDWGWIWSEGGAQKDLESVLDVGGFGYPALVALNPMKMRYSIFKGAFTKSNIDEFLTQLVKTNAIGVEDDIVGKIVNVDAWDGKDSTNELPEELYLHDPELADKEEL